MSIRPARHSAFYGMTDTGARLSQPALAIHRIRLVEDDVSPKSDIGFWKVAKILHFLATFLIHPCTFMNHVELMLSTADWLVKPLYKLNSGSQRLMPAHPQNLTTDQKVAFSNLAGCTPQHQSLTDRTGNPAFRLLGHFSCECYRRHLFWFDTNR
jgi:hypothetical protein